MDIKKFVIGEYKIRVEGLGKVWIDRRVRWLLIGIVEIKRNYMIFIKC